MSGEPRFVINANIIVCAALFAGSIPDRALRLALDRGQILFTRESILELRHVVEPVRVCRDPRDDIYLAIAVAGSAAGIVSGDSDLLVLKLFDGIPILSPSDFLASLQFE
jgi:predicted nucleic acid-binding protein